MLKYYTSHVNIFFKGTKLNNSFIVRHKKFKYIFNKAQIRTQKNILLIVCFIRVYVVIFHIIFTDVRKKEQEENSCLMFINARTLTTKTILAAIK